jgi:hypothetical protein
VRNPWDRLVSCFSRLVQHPAIRWVRRGIHRATTFEDFITNPEHRLWVPQCDFYMDAMGQVLVDDIFRFEDYANAAHSICARLGLDYESLSHEVPSKHKHYTTYYTDATRQIVAEKYARDIDYFGYRFGE